METLLDWLNARTFAAAAVTAAVVFLGVKLHDRPRVWYRALRDSSTAVKTPLATTIERDLDARASLMLRALHRDVSAEITRAVAEGHDVGSLQQTADGLLQFDTPALRSEAVDRLQRLRLIIPRKSLELRAITDEDETEETAPPRAVNTRRARARKP